MQRPIYKETNKQITYDYNNLQNLVENSISIRNFAFKCQDIVSNKLTMDREYYKSAKRFLIIIKLLNIEPRTRIALIKELRRIPNFHQSYNVLSFDGQNQMLNCVVAILKTNEYRHLNLNLGFLLEFSGYIFTKQFKYNSHILNKLMKRENDNRTRRIQTMQLEEESDYSYDYTDED